MASDALLSIRVVLAFDDQQHQLTLQLPQGTTAREAVALAVSEGLEIRAVGEAQAVPIAVFGEQVDDHYVLVQDDRVEILRPLVQSPMELRRQRAAAQQNQQAQRANKRPTSTKQQKNKPI